MGKLQSLNSNYIFNKKETLDWIGYLLSDNHDGASIDQIEQDILRERVNWAIFFSICDKNWILPSVFIVFRDYNLLEIIPKELSDHLSKVYVLNRGRNYLILDQINYLVKLLNKNEIEPIFLKGAANLIDGIYKDLGERFIGDIDLLVDSNDFLKVAQILEQDGFSPREPFNYNALEGTKHYPRLFKDDLIADVEVHRLLANPPFHKFFNYQLIDKRKKRPAKIPTGCFVPDNAHKIIHNFIHSQLNDRAYFRANPSLRQMLDIKLLSNLTNADLAFHEFGHYQEKAKSYLFLVRSVFGVFEHKDSEFNFFPRVYRVMYAQVNSSEKLLECIVRFDKLLQPVRYYGRNLYRACVERSYRRKHIRRLFHGA